MSIIQLIKDAIFQKPKIIKPSSFMEKAYSINEIAEATGLFPFEVEQIMRELFDSKQIRVFWSEKILYVALNSNLSDFIQEVKENHPEMDYIG